jgi:hypothetical protein
MKIRMILGRIGADGETIHTDYCDGAEHDMPAEKAAYLVIGGYAQFVDPLHVKAMALMRAVRVGQEHMAFQAALEALGSEAT